MSKKFQHRKKRVWEESEEKNALHPSSLSKCLNHIKLDWKKNENVAALWHDWPNIAGKQLALNCTPLTFQRGVLTIGSSHPQWTQALMFNRNQLLAELNAKGHKVKGLRIKQHYPKQKPAKVDEPSIWNQHPSRYDIHGKQDCPICKTPCPTGEINLWKKCSLCRRKELSS